MTLFREHDMHGVRVLECPAKGDPIRNERDAVDLIGAVACRDAGLIAIPGSRLESDFFRLKTGVAGQILQKFVTYRLRVAIVGDISKQVAESFALRDFVYECNRGDQIWFVQDLRELDERLHGNRK